MPSHISQNIRWSLLCWGAAFMLGIGWIIPLFFHPDPNLLIPLNLPDALIYTFYIQKAAAGFTQGVLWLLYTCRELTHAHLSFGNFAGRLQSCSYVYR